MSKTHHITLPIGEAQVREMAVGDLVCLDGDIILAAGLPTHRRILEAMAGERPLPFALDNAAFFHLGSYSLDTPDGFEILYANPTTSTRFNALMPAIIRRFNLRIVCGKGGLDVACAQAMKDVGCVYLSILGGGAPLHSEAIREVAEIGWSDLVSHYRLVKLRVEGLGPMTVGIDAHGNSVFDDLTARARLRLPELMAELNATRLTF